MKPYQPGFDFLRCVALLLITWQHAASVLGAYAETQWRGISPGQVGVSMFCAIAGFLACVAKPASTRDWFFKRLLRIYPAYWIVTILAFASVLLVPGKPVTIGLFMSQMLGTGFFTHGWELVNVVSWFVSLILLCYLLAAIFWKSSFSNLFWWITIFLCTLLCVLRIEVSLSRHILSFAAGALIALGATAPLGILTFVLIAVGVLADSQFFYSGAASLFLLPLLRGRFPMSSVFKQVSSYSYEYFLLHGIFLAVMAKIIGPKLLAVIVAIILAMAAAVVLNLIVGKATARLDYLSRQSFK